jgi:hypothetical protein
MCIDQVSIKTIAGKDEVWYKLADRHKAFELFMKCYKIIISVDDNEDRAYKEMAEILRGDNPTLPQKITKAWNYRNQTLKSPEKRHRTLLRRKHRHFTQYHLPRYLLSL